MELWTSTALPPALPFEAEPDMTALANLPMSNNPGGCDIDGEFYMDGMKVGMGKRFNCDTMEKRGIEKNIDKKIRFGSNTLEN